MASKKQPPKREAPKSKSKVAPKPVKTAAMRKAMQNPGKYAGSAKVKAVPYSKNSKAHKQSTLDKVVEGALSFTPLYAIERAVSALSGKDLRSSPYKDGKFVGYKKQNRLSGAIDAAFSIAPVGAPVKKVRNAVRGLSEAEKIIGKSVRRGNTASTAAKSKTAAMKPKRKVK